MLSSGFNTARKAALLTVEKVIAITVEYASDRKDSQTKNDRNKPTIGSALLLLPAPLREAAH